MPLDVETDLQCFDGLETVTVRLPRVAEPITVAGALRRAVLLDEARPGGGKVQRRQVRWHLPAAQLPALPEPGALVIDAEGQGWTVLASAQETLAARIRCLAQALTVVAGLEQWVDVERAAWVQTASGAPEAQWSVWRLGLPAHVQPIEAHTEIVDERLRTRATHRVLLAEEIPSDHNTRLLHGGQVFRVLASEDAARLDRLMSVLVERCQP